MDIKKTFITAISVSTLTISPVDTTEPRNEAATKAGGNDSIEGMRSRLALAVKETDLSLKTLFERAWCLGPHHSGPNILLASETESKGILFNAPASSVVRVGRRVGEILQPPSA